MTCPTCGAASEPGRKFCGDCGTRLAATCPVCGSSNSPAARFCGDCGSRLESDAGRSAAIAYAPAGDTGPARDHPAPVAERRIVTVLFADLVGFTTYAEGRDTEAVRELLNRYFDLARIVIDRYGGTVEKFIGDAVMAVWGAPIAHEDDAERGVRAALELLVAIGQLGDGIQARAGVMTGEAAVSLGARDQGMVAGDLVNTASRLQSSADPGTVLVGDATQRATSESIAYEAAGERLLKGKELPVTVWIARRVVGRRRRTGPVDRLEAPFVGRDAELRLLKDLFHATSREQRARLVSITGQAGIGKTRLGWEFFKYVDGVVEGVWWHEGRSPSYGEGVTFWALGEMIRSRAGLLETDDAETTRRKVGETVAEHVPDEAERHWIEPALLALLGQGEAPPGGRDELFRAWRTFFERLASTGIVGLLFEDLQWADAGLLDFIDHMLEWSRGVPILIITLARPELLDRRPDWGAGRRNFLALGLEPLPEASMRELLAGLAPGLPAPTVRSIVGRADGIPLYAVETIRMLVADGQLREVDGRYEPTGDLGELAVPETLQALIAARLDALEPGDRGLIQDAAVLGHSFTLAGLSAVSGEPATTLEARLRGLSRAELLAQEVDPRSPERGMYSFVQALIREVAYSTLSKRDRRARHLSAARYFEALGEEELAGALAAHYVAAWQAAPEGPEGDAVAAQARLALGGAADRALSLGSPESAVGFLGQALAVTTEPAERAPLLERAGKAAAAALRMDQTTTYLTEAVEIRRSLGDDAGARRAIALHARALQQGRRFTDALSLLEPILPEAELQADPIELAGILATLSTLAASQDRLADGLALIERALPIAERHDLSELLVELLIQKGSLLARFGRPVEGTALAEAARRVAVEHGLLAWEARALLTTTTDLAMGDPRAALEDEHHAIALARRIGRRDMELVIIGNAAEDAFRTGDWEFMTREFAGLEELEIEPSIRIPLESAAFAIRLLRGTASEDDVQAHVTAGGFDDPDVAGSAADADGWVAFANGDIVEAAAKWLHLASLSALNGPFALPKAGLTALLADDPATAAEALERLDETAAHGRAVDLQRQAIRAGIAGLEGRRDESVAGFRAAIAGWRDLGLPWDEALTSLVAVHVLGVDHPETEAAADAAREIFTTLGAVRMLAMLDAEVARGGVTRQAIPRPVIREADAERAAAD